MNAITHFPRMILQNLRSLRAAATHAGAGKPLLVAALFALVSAPAFAVGVITHRAVEHRETAAPFVEALRAKLDPPARPRVVVWVGKDIDGDGAADVVNPTGHAPRGVDGFGSGAFGASRDGGARHHAGVDYVAEGGQPVVAPISGFVTKIGYPYGDDTRLRYVEIKNPALNLEARVFYIDPKVSVGETIRLGTPIGVAQTLQRRYGGITDHVHLELADAAGDKLDAAALIVARLR